MDTCTSCLKPWFAPVRFCPYCGTAAQAGPDHAPPPEPAPVIAPVEPDPAPPQPVAEEARPEKKRGRPAGTPRAKPAPAAEPVAPPPMPPVQPAAPARAERVPAPAKRGSGKANMVVGAAVALAVLFFVFGRHSDDGEQACRTAVEAGDKSLKAGNLAAAAQQSQATAQACTGKHAPLAASFNAELARLTQKTCARPIASARSRLQAHRLAGAQSALDGLDAACQGGNEVFGLKADLAQAQTAASNAAARAAQAIADNDVDGARKAITELEQTDREARDIPRLRAEAAMIRQKQAQAAATAPTPVTVAPQPAQAQIQQPAPAQANPTAAMAERFLKQAESALQQRHFDVAKTYIESARQTDPGNPRIEPLARQIRERERQVLEQETTIK